MQGRREEETGAYWVVREDFRRPRTQQMDFFSSLLDVLDRTRGQLVFGGYHKNEDDVEQDHDAE